MDALRFIIGRMSYLNMAVVQLDQCVSQIDFMNKKAANKISKHPRFPRPALKLPSACPVSLTRPNSLSHMARAY